MCGGWTGHPHGEKKKKKNAFSPCSSHLVASSSSLPLELVVFTADLLEFVVLIRPRVIYDAHIRPAVCANTESAGVRRGLVLFLFYETIIDVVIFGLSSVSCCCMNSWMM